MNTYTIGDVAKISGLQTHTLRYYESKGIVLANRDAQNNRSYSNKDIKWLEILVLLKNMGLSLKQLKEYAAVYYEEPTKNNAIDILLQQEKVLFQQQETISHQLEQVKQKINFLKQSEQNLNACQNKDLSIENE